MLITKSLNLVQILALLVTAIVVAYKSGETKAINSQQTIFRPEQKIENYERTYLMIKPDGVERGLVGEIIKRFEIKGFKMEAIEMLKPSTEHLEEHYAEHKGKPFFPKLIDYMQSGPVVGMVWSGKNVIAETRKFLGATNPINANPGTIRGDFAVDSSKNICHASDSPASAEREIKLWFPRGYIEWTRQTDRVMY